MDPVQSLWDFTLMLMALILGCAAWVWLTIKRGRW